MARHPTRHLEAGLTPLWAPGDAGNSIDSRAGAFNGAGKISIPDASGWYDVHAEALVHRYEALRAAEMHAWLEGFLPSAPALILDVGAGTGRDAAWLASQGYQVLAVEPSGAMRRQGQRLHPDDRIRWLDDRLPALATTLRLGLAADVILLSGVWQHFAPPDQPRAFRKLVSLLKSGGLLAITLRHGLAVVHAAAAPDHQGRPAVSWTQVALRLPDDGTGALPLLRHAILKDQKSATYKLGLLRTSCRAVDGAAGLARDTEGVTGQEAADHGRELPQQPVRLL